MTALVFTPNPPFLVLRRRESGVHQRRYAQRFYIPRARRAVTTDVDGSLQIAPIGSIPGQTPQANLDRNGA